MSREQFTQLLQKTKEPELKYGLGVKFDIKFPQPVAKTTNSYKIISSDATIKPLEQNSKIHSIIKPDENKFTLTNASMWNHGIEITIPRKKDCQVVIEQNCDEETISRILIIAEKDSSATVIIKSSGNSYKNEMIEVIAEENSKLKIATLGNFQSDSINISVARAEVKKNASVDWLRTNFGGKFSEIENTSLLNEQGASSKNFGILFGKENEQIDMYAASLHNAPNTNSDIFIRGVLDDKSKAMIRGLVRIDKTAGNSNGYQKEDILILSENAEGDSIPQLDINNHDVKCSHGATLGTVDKQQLFYLMTRGLNKEQASFIIVSGFFSPVFQRSNFGVEKEIQEIVNKRL